MAKKRKKTTASRTTKAPARKKKSVGRGRPGRAHGSLTRIEEAQMFTDRAVEAVGEQVDGLRRQLEQLIARVVLLEEHMRAYTDASGPEPDQL